MNPTTLRFNIIPILIGAIGLVTALVVGVFIGGSEIANLAIICGAVLLILIIAAMRQHVWLLLPMFWSFTGSVSVLPIPFSVRDLTVLMVAAIGFALLALRIYRFRNRWGFIDVLLVLNVAQVALAFLAHPTGLRAFSSTTVGAKPYFNVAIAFLAYLIVANQVISEKLGRRLPIFVLLPEMFSSVVNLLVRIKPSLGYILGMIYSGFFPPRDVVITQSGISSGVERVNIGGGRTLITVLCSYFRPLTLLMPLYPVRAALFLLGIVLVLISGFRSEFITVGAIFVLSSYFRKGWSETLFVITGMAIGFSALTLINSIHPLPLAVQRAVSFLPGHWNPRAVKDAEDSTEWRVQMWKEIPKSTRYVRDQWMGDGFGFTRTELLAMQRQTMRTGEITQEDSMIIGAFHNGPLSAIRFVGFVGLILYYALLVYLAIYAARIIRAAEDTRFYPLALFVGLILIWEPINYTLVFGAYDSGLPNTIFAVGMLKMISNSIRQLSKPRRLTEDSRPPTSGNQIEVAAHFRGR